MPCQPHSNAGRKQGALDERDLWSPARRIIVQCRPWLVLIENVSGMLSAGDDEIAGAERVRRDLRKLGFAVEAGLFTAEEVGASHERERLFILGLDDSVGLRRGEGRRDHGADDWQQPRAAGEISVANSLRAGLEGLQSKETARSGDERGTVERNRGSVVDAARDGWREGRPQPEFQERNGASSAESGSSMDDTKSFRGGPIPVRQGRQEQAQTDTYRPGAFPPGPGDFGAWRDVLARAPQLEPSVRRMVDGVAARVDLSGPHAARVERIRLLGNGVVPLEAAYAIRTLLPRLAAAGSSAAAFLVRVMESAE
ncbi:DNA cytosine methyltransferase [Labrys neptuniae]